MKIKKKNKDIFQWVIWLILVILWNYSYPNAIPLYDVLVAAALSLIFILVKK